MYLPWVLVLFNMIIAGGYVTVTFLFFYFLLMLSGVFSTS